MIFKKKQERRIIEKDRENLLINFKSNSRYAESYRTMRTNLFFSDMEKEIKTAVVTSSVEKEGKTTTAVNLAYSIAQTDRRVLLMDCDLRRPHMSALFIREQENNIGVTELLTEVFGARVTRGSLDTYSVGDLIRLTGLQKRSGRLDIENAKTQVAVFFDKGKMTDIYWKNRPERKKLANTLVREKLLTEKEAALALGHQKKSVQRLGSVLYTMGFVSKKDLIKALSLHSIEAVRALAAIEDGHFVFSPASSTDSKTTLSHNLDFEKLYLEFSTAPNMYTFLDAVIEKAICPTDSDSLYFMPAGTVPPNPAELAGSQRMAFLIDTLAERYDFIIIDTPPVTPATDALLIAPKTDGTVFVIKSGHTNKKIVQGAIDQFKSAKQPIIGTVLNQVDFKKEGYYRYYHKYYSSYYGQ